MCSPNTRPPGKQMVDFEAGGSLKIERKKGAFRPKPWRKRKVLEGEGPQESIV